MQFPRVFKKFAAVLPVLALAMTLLGPGVSACGGLFCQNDPVDQVGERILFSVNDDETISSLIEIQYFGEAADFSWILPIPEAIAADDLQVPEGGDQVFTELHSFTDVQIIAPPRPACAEDRVAMSVSAEDDAMEESGDVEIFASGEVGPFGFDVIGSDDPMALITWLQDNNYRVDPPMEPLINVYVEEQFAFVAMRLLDGETSDSISPIEITYPGTQPMIPLRLTAVAAQNQMPIWTWVFADAQAVPENYAHMEIATEELTFSEFGGNDYIQLVQRRADALDGQAFITEFATSTENIGITLSHPYLVERLESHQYLTRLTTYIDPDEMTVDPVFGFDADRPDVSNIRDASELRGLYSCEREAGGGQISFNDSDALDPITDEGEVAATPADSTDPGGIVISRGVLIGGVAVLVAGFFAYLAGARKREGV